VFADAGGLLKYRQRIGQGIVDCAQVFRVCFLPHLSPSIKGSDTAETRVDGDTVETKTPSENGFQTASAMIWLPCVVWWFFSAEFFQTPAANMPSLSAAAFC
jgi:hypothetical protein